MAETSVTKNSPEKYGPGLWAAWRTRRPVLGPLDYTRRWWMELIVAATSLML